MKAVTYVYRDAVDRIVEDLQPYLELSQNRFDPESIPARRRLLAHYRKILANMLRWKKHSGSLFGIDAIVERLVQDAVLPVANSGWDVGGGDAMREVWSSFGCFLYQS